MLKKKFLALLAAVALACGAVGCKAESEQMTPQTYAAATSAETEETTTAPQNADIGIVTLAEGEERDWKIEDVMKNDLEIDGISISIPCTVGELLDTLGKNYSFDKDELLEERDSKFRNSYLYYKGEKTDTSIDVLYEKDTEYKDLEICTVGCLGHDDNAVLTFKGLNGKYNKFIKKYPNPDKLEIKKTGQRKFTSVMYDGGDYYFTCCFHNDDLGMFFIGLKTGGNENE